MSRISTTGVKPPKRADELLDMYYLQARSHLLETAAILDRIERADNSDDALNDKRVKQLSKMCDVLKTGKKNRAEQILNLLSV